MGGRATLVIFFFFGKMSPFLPSGSHPGMKLKKKEEKKATQLCHDSDCKRREVTLSLFTAVIALSITDYKCTPHGLVLFALLHHVAPSSLKVRPTRDAQRNSRVPGRPLAVASECSGSFIASGSNCTYIWWSFVELKPP